MIKSEKNLIATSDGTRLVKEIFLLFDLVAYTISISDYPTNYDFIIEDLYGDDEEEEGENNDKGDHSHKDYTHGCDNVQCTYDLLTSQQWRVVEEDGETYILTFSGDHSLLVIKEGDDVSIHEYTWNVRLGGEPGDDEDGAI